MIAGHREPGNDRSQWILGHIGLGPGSSCEPTRPEGASFAQRTLCTLSVAGDRVTWPLPPAAVRARRAVKWFEKYGEVNWPSTRQRSNGRRLEDRSVEVVGGDGGQPVAERPEALGADGDDVVLVLERAL